MFSSLHGRSRHIACAAAAAVSAVAGALPCAAVASHRTAHSTRLEILRPYRTAVSGKILLSVRGVAPFAQRVVFTIDGHRVWSGGQLPPRASGATVIDTRKLANGKHVLGARVFYAGQQVEAARKTIVVRNVTPVAHVAQAGTGGAANVGVVGATPIAGPSVANFNRETYQYSTQWSLSQEASRYQFIVLAGNEHALVPQLKALNPNLKVLLYQSPLQTNRNDYSYLPTVTGCTAYADDIANHPDWFLRDQNGNVILGPGSTSNYVMDVGNPGYQQACAANAAALAKQYGFDGVFLDQIDIHLGWELPGGVQVPEYPTQASWTSAMNSAVSYLGSALRAQGLLSFGNVSWTGSAATWEQLVSHIDGVEEESWTDGGLGLAQQVPFWSRKFSTLAWAAANGKYEILHSYNGSEAGNTFGLAAMLLAANGRASYATSNTNYTFSENWFPEYDSARLLGAPAGPYRVLSNGVYERPFSNGIVLVNPKAAPVPRFSLGEAAYSGSGVINARSVQMGATSGLILIKAAG